MTFWSQPLPKRQAMETEQLQQQLELERMRRESLVKIVVPAALLTLMTTTVAACNAAKAFRMIRELKKAVGK